jgi:hypothetical protein
VTDIIQKDPFQLPDEEVKGVEESIDRFLSRVEQICVEHKQKLKDEKNDKTSRAD